MPDDRHWIDDVELENITVKWAFSHFDGREDTFNGAGEHNFTIVLPDDVAEKLRAEGWAIRDTAGYEEGDPDEHLLKVKISDKFEMPKIFLLKGTRKIQVDGRKPGDIYIRDLQDIRRDTCEQIDVIITPSRWVNGQNSGITAYVKELYAKVRESRFAAKYADYEDV